MSKEEFELKQATLEAIRKNEVKYPGIPVDVALHESEDLFVWCQTDKEALVEAGLYWNLVEDLLVRTGACRYIQSQWQKEYRNFVESQKEWKLKSPVAYKLRNDLLHHFFHAYYRFPDLYART